MIYVRLAFSIAFSCSLVACGGGGISSLPQSAARSANFLTKPESDALLQRNPRPIYTSSPADLLYVGNRGNNSISVYKHDVSGNTAPIAVIAGVKTGISSPSQLSEDAQGNLYVATPTSILVFAHGSNGNVRPIRTLTGPATGFNYIEAMTVDQSTSKLFVVDGGPNKNPDSLASLLRFPPNANGNTPPFARGAANLEPTAQIASDSTGQNVIVSHLATCCNSGEDGVTTAAKQFYNNDAPTVKYGISYFFNLGVTDDPTTRTYLVSQGTITSGQGIVRLAEPTTGVGPNPYGPENLNPAPVSVITSDTCGTQLALGYLRNIYVTHNKSYGCSADAIYVYTHDSSGNVPPLRVLSGAATGLNQPYGIYEGQ